MGESSVPADGGDAETPLDGAADWTAFLQRHQESILRVIGRMIHDDDDRMDVFAVVCEVLSAVDAHRRSG